MVMPWQRPDPFKPLKMQDSACFKTHLLDHNANLDIESPKGPALLSKIMCTLGDSCLDPQVFGRMMKNGMAIARVDMSIGDQNYHLEQIRKAREAVMEYSAAVQRVAPIAIAAELKGPQILTGEGVCAATTRSDTKMTSRTIYHDAEDALAELRSLQADSDCGESSNPNCEESASESEDELLDDCVAEDVFECEGNDGERTTAVVPEDVEFGKDGATMWMNKPMKNERSVDVIEHIPGPKGDARGVTNEEQLFSLFFNDDMIGDIVRYTNHEIERSKLKSVDPNHYVLRSTCVAEIKALIGLLYMSGVMKNSGLSQQDLFSEAYGPPVFRCTMPQKRFDFLLQNLRFDYKISRESRRAKDKFAAFREMWNTFNMNCAKYYNPSEYLTVDETVYGFRGICPFKVTRPSIPKKYGLKIVSLCDSKTFYSVSGIPCINKDQNDASISTCCECITRLTESVAGSNRNITCNNQFTSFQLAEELLKKKLTLVGSLRKVNQEIPQSMLLAAPAGSSKFMYHDSKTIVSFNLESNKKILLMSSMHHVGELNNISGEPEILEFYKRTKSSVAVKNKIMIDASTKRNTTRWPMMYFFEMLDTVALNSYVLFKFNSDPISNVKFVYRIFLKNLAFSLTKHFMETRMDNLAIFKSLRWNIAEALGKQDEFRAKYDPPKVDAKPKKPFMKLSKKRKRCYLCEASKDRKGNEFCFKCNSCICGEHKSPVCVKCASNDGSSGENEM
ncbi:hypothetical protein GE061_001895 [Apolygus lucorum]|uniref:PiggyBac transposable element-derived protein domain-containing protein n=1 Tax=Apolygus lucorum TaxID=248454 RepID=A0A8S9X3M9_APOLU|nr:hypothetical protein GE061_001895 [Apolygus lucorum]